MEEVAPVLEEKERSASYKPVFVTEITDDLHFYVQDVETGEYTNSRTPCVQWEGRTQPTRSGYLFQMVCGCSPSPGTCVLLWGSFHVPQVSPGVGQAKQVL